MDTVLFIAGVAPYDSLCRWLYIYDYIERGIHVEFWNVGKLMYDGKEFPSAPPAIPQRIFDDKAVFLEALRDVPTERTLCSIECNGEAEAFEIYTAVKERGLTTSYTHCQPWPSFINSPVPLRRKLKKLATHPLEVARNQIEKRLRRRHLDEPSPVPPRAYPDVFTTDYVFSSTTHWPEFVDRNRSRLVKCSSMEYEAYLKEKDLPPHPVGKDTCVFIDQTAHYHPDHEVTSKDRRFLPEEGLTYLASLRVLFDRIEREWKMPVVIAAHPKATYSGGEFGDRPVIWHETSSLIRGAKTVIAHYSSSVMYAVAWQKPILFVITDELRRRQPNSGLILHYAHMLDCEVYDTASPPKHLRMSEVNLKRYQNVLLNCATWPELVDKPAGPILADFVRRL
jgi:hypothetical protein